MNSFIASPTNKNIEIAVELLKSGEVVAVPTETVYGFAADAFNVAAVEKIYDIKKRPKKKPLSCNISSLDMLGILTKSKSKILYDIAEMFWPGPLTVVVEKAPNVPYFVTANAETVAIRFSSNSTLKKLTNIFKKPIVIPSANISFMSENVTAYEVYSNFKGRIKLILDGGKSKFCVASTIVKVCSEHIEILREGAIAKDIIKRQIKNLDII